MAHTEEYSAESAAKIDAAIAAYNGERAGVAGQVAWRVPVFLGAFLLGIAALAYVAIQYTGDVASIPAIIVYVAGVFGSFWVYSIAMGPATALQAGLRDKALPLVFDFVSDLQLLRGATPDSFASMPTETTGAFNRKSFDDVISGTYDGLPFELYEAVLTQKAGKSSSQIFKGVILNFPLDTPFPGTLVALRRNNALVKWLTETFSSSALRHVEGADRVLEADYDFRTDNDEAARALIAGPLGKALNFLRDQWAQNNPPRLALVATHAYLLLPQVKNYFELPGIRTPLSRQGHIEPMAHELKLLLASAHLAAKIGK